MKYIIYTILIATAIIGTSIYLWGKEPELGDSPSILIFNNKNISAVSEFMTFGEAGEEPATHDLWIKDGTLHIKSGELQIK